MDFLKNLNPVIQALFATGFTWAMTASGASLVFLGREPSKRLLDALLGFAAGVMIAAGYWSLLAPAIEISEGKGIPTWVPATVGFLFGGIFLRGVDRLPVSLLLLSPRPWLWPSELGYKISQRVWLYLCPFGVKACRGA